MNVDASGYAAFWAREAGARPACRGAARVSLLGDRVSSGARLFLLAIALVRRFGTAWLYLPLGIALWFAVHESGVHATIAGVALGLLMPVAVGEPVEHRLHPLSALVIVPLFALANAGVAFGGGALGDAAGSSLTLAIVVGLVVGKFAGIAGATLLALRLRWGVLPDGVTRAEVFGLAALAGIGFTVSLFIAELAFDDAALVSEAKVGIFAGSILSGLLGTALLVRRGAR